MSGKYIRTKLALNLGIIPPSDSYTLSCGLPNKIRDAIQFWIDVGYKVAYDPIYGPENDSELFINFIKDEKLKKYTTIVIS